MGISGLISFVSSATEKINIKDVSGKKVAIDSYCLLHKGAFGCAEILALGQNTDKYVTYCMKYIDLLRSYKISIIMVFDGRHLPAKASEEKVRRDARKENKSMAAQYLRLGQKDMARKFIARSIDVSHQMALNLIKACRSKGIDCIVAPYEADAQLAYLSTAGYVDYVITEDSDLILFGCNKILFKLQLDGSALAYDKVNLHKTMNILPDKFQFSYFRRMCILSGCDYLPSLYGVGLQKAKSFILKTRDTDFKKAILRIGVYLNKNINVPDDYIDKFFKAEATFMYQYVYDPKDRKLVRLNKLEDVSEDLLTETGKEISAKEAFQHALGNLDPFSLAVVDNWDPDQDPKLLPTSIWSRPDRKEQKPILSTSKSSPKKTVNTVSTYRLGSKTITEICNDELKDIYFKIEIPTEKKRKRESINTECLTPKHKNVFSKRRLLEDTKNKSPPKENIEKPLLSPVPNQNKANIEKPLLSPVPNQNKANIEKPLLSPVPNQNKANIEKPLLSPVPNQNKANIEKPLLSPVLNQNKAKSAFINRCYSFNLNFNKEFTTSNFFKSQPAKTCSLDEVNFCTDVQLETCLFKDDSDAEKVACVIPSISQVKLFKHKEMEQPETSLLSNRCRRLGLSKKISLPSNQNLLTKYGFTKKPALKVSSNTENK